MIATVAKKNVEGINRTHREREEKNGLHRGYKAVTVLGGSLFDLVDLRTAYSGGGTAYACIWVHGPVGPWNSGSGVAGGYGYDKASAAAEEAINRAGIHLSENIGGRGNAAVRDAVQAIGEAVAPEGATVYVVEMWA